MQAKRIATVKSQNISPPISSKVHFTTYTDTISIFRITNSLTDLYKLGIGSRDWQQKAKSLPWQKKSLSSWSPSRGCVYEETIILQLFTYFNPLTDQITSPCYHAAPVSTSFAPPPTHQWHQFCVGANWQLWHGCVGFCYFMIIIKCDNTPKFLHPIDIPTRQSHA